MITTIYHIRQSLNLNTINVFHKSSFFCCVCLEINDFNSKVKDVNILPLTLWLFYDNRNQIVQTMWNGQLSHYNSIFDQKSK